MLIKSHDGAHELGSSLRQRILRAAAAAFGALLAFGIAPPQAANAQPGLVSRADYCRRVGDENFVSSHIACTVSKGTGFGLTYYSDVIDWGQDVGVAWVDFDGDRRADYCRRVGDENFVSSYVACTVSKGTGFGPTYYSDVIDWGLDVGVAWVDFNVDGRADYCRRVGDENFVSSYVACTVSTGTGFGPTYYSDVIEWGYDVGVGWADFNADGRADYCRRVGDENYVSSYVACTVSTGTGFGPSYYSDVIDWGYDIGFGWVDFNADGRADYCRRDSVSSDQLTWATCTLSTGTGFGLTFTSGVIEPNPTYFPGAWADQNADGRADYCTPIGQGVRLVVCYLSTGGGFAEGTTNARGEVREWGRPEGFAWTDFDGDHRADFCRRVGDENFVSSRLECMVSAGTDFGPSYTSGVLDWGYDVGTAWVDFNGPEPSGSRTSGH